MSTQNRKQVNELMTQSATTFEKTLQGIVDPSEAMQSGMVQVSDFDSLVTYWQLFSISWVDWERVYCC